MNINVAIHPDNLSLSLLLISSVLLVGLLGGIASSKTKILPQMSGYVLVGLILGAVGFDFLTPSIANLFNVFIDICLGLILFELGKTFNIGWTDYDKSLLIYGITACIISFACMYITLILLGFSVINSIIISTVCITSSPAIIFMIAKEQGYEGPVVRRTKNLLVINNLVGAFVFILILPYLHYKSSANLEIVLMKPAYYLFGSLAISSMAYLITSIFSYFLGKNQTNQYIMQTAVLILIVGLSYLLNLPVVLNLLFFGVLVKNFSFENKILDLELKNPENIFFILLFVTTAASLKWNGFMTYFIPVLLLIAARTLGQFIVIYFGSIQSKYTKKQAFLTGAAISPMGAITYWMAKTTFNMFPTLVSEETKIITLSILFMQILGPIVTYWSFRIAEKEQSA